MKIIEENDTYIISDSTDGGYVTRVSRYICNWKTVWDKKLNLLEFYFDERESSFLLSDKKDYDYHRARRAVGRHKRALQEMLGLIEEKRPKEKQSIILYENSMLFPRLRVIDAVVQEKTLGLGTLTVKKNSVKFSPVTEEKIKLANEFNERLEEFNQFKEEIFRKIFEDGN